MTSIISKLSLLPRVLKSFDVLVYSETANDWTHIGTLVEKLMAHSNIRMGYLYSDKNEDRSSLIEKYGDRVSMFHIGNGMFRSFIFPQLHAATLIMTLTDLGGSRLKKSPNVDTYLYIFHSITSTHMCYLEDSFDNYDTIFCVGPHHRKEIRKRELLHGLPEKRLVNYGHARIEELRLYFDNHQLEPDARKIIIAPSWGPTSIIETLPSEFYTNLLNAGFSLYVRLHSMSASRRQHFAADIEALAQAHENIHVDFSHLSLDLLNECCLMISDWSGAATEFAFGLKRPVIFVDTPKKVRNEAFEKLEIEPIEVSIRPELGRVVSIEDAIHVGSWLAEFIDDKSKHPSAEEIDKQYRSIVFTNEPSWTNGLKALSTTHTINL